MIVPHDDRVIKRGDIPKIMSVENMKIITYFLQCETFSVLPFSGGLLEQPCIVYDIWTGLKSELGKRQADGKGQGIRRHRR